MNVKIPDTITTWVMQAFATNTETGMGVAPPYELVAFKPFFVQLNLPYSMIRNEQIMLSATIFNFGDTKSTVRRSKTIGILFQSRNVSSLLVYL